MLVITDSMLMVPDLSYCPPNATNTFRFSSSLFLSISAFFLMSNWWNCMSVIWSCWIDLIYEKIEKRSLSWNLISRLYRNSSISVMSRYPSLLISICLKSFWLSLKSILFRLWVLNIIKLLFYLKCKFSRDL